MFESFIKSILIASLVTTVYALFITHAVMMETAVGKMFIEVVNHLEAML